MPALATVSQTGRSHVFWTSKAARATNTAFSRLRERRSLSHWFTPRSEQPRTQSVDSDITDQTLTARDAVPQPAGGVSILTKIAVAVVGTEFRGVLQHRYVQSSFRVQHEMQNSCTAPDLRTTSTLCDVAKYLDHRIFSAVTMLHRNVFGQYFLCDLTGTDRDAYLGGFCCLESHDTTYSPGPEMFQHCLCTTSSHQNKSNSRRKWTCFPERGTIFLCRVPVGDRRIGASQQVGMARDA